MHDLAYTFTTKLWRWKGAAPAAWHFLTLPKSAADEIRFFHGAAKGFMPIPVSAAIGDTRWKTSVFPDSKSGSYLLAVKAAVRKAENIGDGDDVTVSLSFKSER